MSAARVVTRSRAFELPLVRVVLERTPGLEHARGRSLRTSHAAARVLAPFLDGAPPTQRLAMALLDARQRLLAVALLDGGEWHGCCLRPSEVFAPALVTGAASLYLAHRHPSQEPSAVRSDCDSLEGLARLGQSLGLCVNDHLIFGAGGRYASLHASWDHCSDWRHMPLTHRWSLPVYGSCADDDGRTQDRRRGVQGSRGGARTAAPAARTTHAGHSLAHGPCFTLCGLHARLDYDEPGLRLARPPRVHTHADVALALADGVERHRGAVIAGLLDRSRRLFALARIDADGDGDGCACETVEPQAIYRTAIACGAHAVFLAHDHKALATEAADTAGAWTARVYALGSDLGLELRDHLVFGMDEGLGQRGRYYMSLRKLGQGVPEWRKGADLAAAPDNLRMHQAMWNRRPQRPALTRSLAARAALQACTACGRRSGIKAACPWCGEPRSGVSTEMRPTSARAHADRVQAHRPAEVTRDATRA